MHALLTAALVLGTITTPTSTTVYGYAWLDGQGAMRITPVAATLVTKQNIPRYALKAIPHAKEVKLDYSGADYRRLTLACDLKETEGRLALDSRGLGKTRCAPSDLDFALTLQPTPVRVVYSGGKATKVNEFLPAKYYTKTAKGMISRVDGDTIAFKRLNLSYNWQLTFNRVTAKCQDGWLTGKPVNADDDGLGTKGCTYKDFSRALKHPSLAVVHYNPFSNQLLSVWEVFGDA